MIGCAQCIAFGVCCVQDAITDGDRNRVFFDGTIVDRNSSQNTMLNGNLCVGIGQEQAYFMRRFGFTIMLKVPTRNQRAVTKRYGTQFSFEIYGPSEMDAPTKDQQAVQCEVTSGISFDHQSI